jgi:methylenetetrahydrofolate reductase (NADPH)
MAFEGDPKQAVMSFMDGYSIEATTHDADRLEAIAEAVPKGTAVYVAHPPGSTLDEVVVLAGKLRELGFDPVPHIIARKLESREQLEGGLEKLRGLGIDRALCIAGDIAVPDHAFDSSLEVLQTELLSRYGFRKVGIAGHPEGSKAIGDERAKQALLDKVAFGRNADFEMYIATQFGFDPATVTRWEAETSAQGIDIPIYVGLAGPASLRQLARFAVMCGVGASARWLMNRTGATANLLKTKAPDDQIVHFARHRAENPSTRLAGAHFFAFGGVVKTANWANAVRAGQFAMNRQGTGFDVT